MNDKILQNDERAVYELRSLYAKYGYLPYKMSKFEEYDLYVKNKDFFLGDGVITFNDNGGKLLALKPDVTLSILKNGAKDKQNQKVYYNETVYRKSADGNFKEIMQVGLENIGILTPYDIFETVYLAVKSLVEIGGKDMILYDNCRNAQVNLYEELAQKNFNQNILIGDVLIRNGQVEIAEDGFFNICGKNIFVSDTFISDI
ncbi:MAG: ATP phosphoribosyltransferase regulatory subunit, partial [Clostridia bacterium]|nr:ATP phosphoribosyltransferase regulatory subunit [Clostridia bacterium]